MVWFVLGGLMLFMGVDLAVQNGFSESWYYFLFGILALLIAAAGPELDWYANQTAFSPDIIGQVYLTCLELGPPFWPYFPPWPAALEVAQVARSVAQALSLNVPLAEAMAIGSLTIEGHPAPVRAVVIAEKA